MIPRLYLIILSVVLLTIAGLSIQVLRLEVARKNDQIVTLTQEKKQLEAAQVALAETYQRRLETTKAVSAIKETIEREEDTDLPPPIARALDGLRDRAR